jgi:PASTA domain-containing protein
VRRALGVAVAVLAVAAPLHAQFGPNGVKAYDMARAADDAARLAHDEGGETLGQLQALKPSPRNPEGLKVLVDQAQAAAEALDAFRKLTQDSADRVIEQLAELPRTRPDPARREQVEQRALLDAYEAAVMSARARSQAERLRALLAEARVVLAGTPSSGTVDRAPAAGARPAAPSAASPAPAGNEVDVPNVVGARLDEATRDLTTAGLRIGATTGPREGFIVKQTPAAGTRVARQSAVTLTLSTTAVGVTPLPPPR